MAHAGERRSIPISLRRSPRHFSALPRRPLANRLRCSALSRAAKRSRDDGIPSRDVPACLGCHGRPGPQPVYPELSGQPAEYVASQLKLFRAGKRGGTRYEHLMRNAAKNLSDEDIAALAAYCSANAARCRNRNAADRVRPSPDLRGKSHAKNSGRSSRSSSSSSWSAGAACSSSRARRRPFRSNRPTVRTRRWPSPTRPAPDRQRRRGKPWPDGHEADRGARALPSTSSPAGSTIRAGCTCCRMATCWSPRATRRPSPTKGSAFAASFMDLFQSQAGAEVPSANRISLLRDQDGDGVAETKTAFLTGLNSPFGMTLLDGKLYVANADAIVAFPYQDGATEITAPAEKIVDLPAGRNHHWTKDVIASPDGTKLYATVGSNSQCRRERHGGGGEPRRRAGDRPRHAADAALRLRPAQPQRPVLEPGKRRALGRRQRARRDRQRPRARLHDLGEGRRLLRLALQLLRPACRCAGRSRRGRIWSRRRSCRTMRSGRTPPRSA